MERGGSGRSADGPITQSATDGDLRPKVCTRPRAMDGWIQGGPPNVLRLSFLLLLLPQKTPPVDHIFIVLYSISVPTHFYLVKFPAN